MRNIAITRTGENRSITFAFRFKGISQLLDEEDETPFPEKELTEHAEETLVKYLGEYVVKRDVRFVLSFPETDLPPDAGTIIPETIRHHFLFHTDDVRHDLVVSWKEGVYSLIISLVNALVAVIIMTVLDSYKISIESFPAVLLVGFITILNWVTIWDTYEHYMYDYLFLKRKLKIYEKISRIPISIEGY